MGLDAGCLGAASFERAVRARQRACGGLSDLAYLARLQHQADEAQGLIESLVVNETWFYREPDALVALARIAVERLQAGATGVPLRVLSLPCSTGEEPYSIAMALLDAGVPDRQFSVDAVDISAGALERARLGRFDRNSFRGGDLRFRSRHFTEAGGAFHLRDAVRSSVRFRQGNLFSPDLMHGVEPYDVVFCRNLLIYFDEPTKARAAGVLARLLSPDGHLFVGSAESVQIAGSGFSPVRFPTISAFRRARPDRVAPASEPGPRIATQAVPDVRRREAVAAPLARAAPTNIANRAPAATAPPPLTSAPVTLEAVSQLADQGQFASAERLCEQVVAKQGLSAQALYLMGLIRGAQGNDWAAIESYRKAIYLDAAHQPALHQLAALLERRGDIAGADLLKARLARAKARSRAA